MRTALVNENPTWGGGERWFADAAVALRRRGHEVIASARRGTQLAERLHDAQVPTVIFEDGLAALLAEAPAVVLCNSQRDVRAVRRAGRGDAGPAVVLRRGLDKRLRDGLFRRGLWQSLSRILVNSEASRQTVQRSLPWFPRERITRIYNPVRFTPTPRLPPPAGVVRLGAVGRLTPQKGFDVLLDALAQLDPALGIQLEIAGEGKSRPELEQQIERLGLADRCRLLGHVTDVAPVYARLDVVAIPSRYEGFCFTAVEAALAGLPVVASRVSSLPEVTVEGEGALLVPADDAPALAAAITRLARSPEERDRMGRAGREHARARFAPEALYDELEDALTRAAGEPPVGRR
jgi:glycosyltransferase involved in cell wall biosynthesis